MHIYKKSQPTIKQQQKFHKQMYWTISVFGAEEGSGDENLKLHIIAN